MIKHLITGGCSFSADNFCWPRHLAKQLNVTHDQTGVGSSDNSLISRKVIQAVHQKMSQGIDPSDICVGIMWSGPTRKSFYINDPQRLKLAQPYDSETSPHSWPTSLDKWVLIGSGFRSRLAQGWFKTYQHDIQDQIETYEHMLRVQWFLKSHNIKYFYTTFLDSVLEDPNGSEHLVGHLKHMIDWDKFLPVTSMAGWCHKKYPTHFPAPPDEHPGDFQHNRFAAEVIIPWLQRNA